MRRTFIPGIGALILILASQSGAAGEIKLPAVLADNMVLQRDMALPVWGSAGPGEEVTVELAGAKVSTKADGEGRFKLRLPAQEAGGPLPMTVRGSSGASRTLQNVLIGEVWVCSGQSNMEWPLQLSSNAQEAIGAASHPTLRLFTIPHTVAERPEPDSKGSWVACTPQTVPGFSAVAYFFGIEIQEELKVPVGLINTSWGGTPAEAWTSRNALEAEPSLRPLLERWDRTIAEKPGEKGSPHRPANLYNGMIAPLIPFAIRGAIWYQGESNASRAEEYRTLFPAMIRNWRADWGRDEFPFFFVQLANFMARKTDPGESAWAELRHAQLHALRTVARTGMAVIIDIGDEKDIHPRNKLDVGKRLARWALSGYGKAVVPSGPLYESMERKDDKVILRFDHARGLKTPDGQPLKGFAIAGGDKKWVWAEAKIEGSQVVVWSPSVKDPTAVRYGWADNPDLNLQNAEGLPASPFRTDDWPVVALAK